jgi:type II secretory pathway pseudopilin PulG
MKNSQAGFTLIETLLYVLFLSFIIGGALGATYEIIQNGDRTAILIADAAEANFLLRKLDWALIGASAVSFPAPGQLAVTRWSTPTSVRFRLNSTDMEMDDGDGWTVLNGNGMAISSVSFTHLTTPEGVRTDFAVNGLTYTMTKYLRQ